MPAAVDGFGPRTQLGVSGELCPDTRGEQMHSQLCILNLYPRSWTEDNHPRGEPGSAVVRSRSHTAAVKGEFFLRHFSDENKELRCNSNVVQVP